MADPLSLSASLAGLITLADSIFRASFKYAKSAKHAKEEASNLAIEAQDLAGVLHRLSLRASALELEPNADRPTLRLHHVISCRQLLLRVEKTLAKATADFDSSNSRNHLKATLKWPFSSTDTKQMLEEIARHRGTLALALTADSMDALSQCLTNQKDLQAQMAAINQGVRETREIAINIEINAQKRRVLDFFLPVKPQQSLAQAQSLRHPMTGLWLIDGEDFQQWLAAPRSNLWLTGIPGAGKTVLAGAMITEALRFSSDSTGVAFFFCEYKNQQSHQALNILQTMASQLALQNRAAYSVLEEYHKELEPLEGLGNNLSLRKMMDVLQHMASCFEKVYVIIDGLDECGDNAVEVASTLVSTAEEQQSAISLAFLSRDEYHIREVLQDSFTRLDIAARKEDVRLYVATEITSRMQQGKLRLRNMALKDEILHALVDGNGGMFRWVTCQLDYLCELPRDKDRRQALKTLPPTLNETYERILQRVEKKDPSIRKLVRRTLEYITAAYPPLTLSQLLEAVSIEEDTEYLEEDDLFDEATIFQHCSSLIRIRSAGSKPDSIVEFSHFSVAEYLQGPSLYESEIHAYHTTKERAEGALMRACLRFILLKQMAYEPTAKPDDVKHILQRNKDHPFYTYASLFWFVFLDDAENDETVLRLVKELFKPEKSSVFLAWALHLFGCTLMDGVFDPDMASLRYYTPAVVNRSALLLEPNFTTMHFAAILGLSGVCGMLLEGGSDVNALCTRGTPLHCAMLPAWLLSQGHRVYNGYRGSTEPGKQPVLFPSNLFHTIHDQERPQIVRLFLNRGAIVINSPNPTRSNVETKRLSLFTDSLVTSLRIGNFDIVVMLLEAGIELQLEDLEGFRNMALHWTPPPTISGTEIRNNVTTFLSAIKSMMSQSDAAANLYPYALDFITSMSRYLESFREGPPPKSDHVQPPMADPGVMAILAAQSDDERTLQRIIGDQRIDINRRLNSKGDTLLRIAVQNKSAKAVQLLLRSGADPSIKDFQGQLPLWQCLSDTHCQILSMILDKDPHEAYMKDRTGSTIWHMAAQVASVQPLRVLIEKSSNLERDLRLQNYNGDSPFAISIKESQPDHAIAMIDSCPKIVCSWTLKSSLLELAAKMGSFELLQKLVDTGLMAPDRNPADLSTPLHHIGTCTSIDCVRFLKSIFPGINDTRDIHGARPDEAFVTNRITSRPVRTSVTGSLTHIANVVDELLPSNFIDVSETGATFWEQLCSRMAAQIASVSKTTAAGDIFFRMEPEPLAAIIKRLIEVGLITAHEKERKRSSLYPFASTFESVFDADTVSLLRETLPMILDATEYLEEARTSDSLVGILHQAIRISEEKLVMELLARGVDLQKQLGGYNALQTACAAWSQTETRVFQAVLENTESNTINNLTTPGGKERSLAPIHLIGERKRSFSRGYLYGYRARHMDENEMLSLLISRGADPNLLTGSKVPVIIFYIMQQDTGLACHLLEFGADPSLVDANGYDAVTHAVLRGNVKFLARLRYLEQEGRLPYKIQWKRTVAMTWSGKWRYFRKNKQGYDSVARGSQVNGNPTFEECNTLHLAALQGHTNVLEFLLQEDLVDDINSPSKIGWTALHFAVYQCSTGSIRCLHKWGADMSSKGGKGVPLFNALETQGKERDAIIQTLIELGAQPPNGWFTETSKNFISRTVFEEGEEDDSDDSWDSDPPRIPNWYERAEMPPTHRSSVLGPNHGRMDPRSRYTDLREVIQSGNLEQFQLKWMVGERHLSCPHCTLVGCAVISGEPSILDWLIDREAEIDVPINCPFHDDSDVLSRAVDRAQGIPRKSPWLSAAHPNLTPVLSKVLCQYLVQNGSSTILDEFPDTPLNTALRTRNYPGAVIIVNHVKDHKEEYRRRWRHYFKAKGQAPTNDPLLFLVNHRDSDGNSPLYWAVRSGSISFLRALVENGADVNSAGRDGRDDLLHSAIRAGKPGIVEYLLESGISVEKKDATGRTPLQETIREGDLEIFSLLLQQEADVRTLCIDAYGPLLECCHSLCQEWHMDKVEMLLTLLGMGLDPDQPSGWGLTPSQLLLPLHVARRIFLSRIVSLERTPPISWKSYYVTEDICLFDDPKFYLLVRALGRDNLARVINLHPSESEGYSPLCIAACHDSVTTMENLILIGADIEFEGSIYGTALMAACDHGRLSSAKFLVRRGARLTYTLRKSGGENGEIIYRSALQAARKHPQVIEWLLVGRHTEQRKIWEMSQHENDSTVSESCEGAYHWGGPVRAAMILSKLQRKQSWESSIDWLVRLKHMRLFWGGKVVEGAKLWPDLDVAHASEI
ncbi:Ankyrin repeat-containing domain protein [Naviculisporaceae sp. PSN 640]